jgi:hypothetical protein
MFKEIAGDKYKPLNELMIEMPIERKNKVLSYMKKAPVIAVSPTLPRDVISGERIPGELLMHEKDGYSWRSDVIYYVDKYNLTLPDDFIALASA